MIKSKLLLILSVALLVQSSQINYQGVSNYYSDNFIYKSLLNEIKNSLTPKILTSTKTVTQQCTITSKKSLFLKNKSQIKPVNNTSTYTIQLKFSLISALKFKYVNGVYSTTDSVPLQMNVNTTIYDQTCSNAKTTYQKYNILASNISYTKRLNNINGALTPQVTFSWSLSQTNKFYSAIDPNALKAIQDLQKKLEEKVNSIFVEVQSPLIPQKIYNQTPYVKVYFTLGLVSLKTSNPLVSNGNYISILNSPIPSTISSKISNKIDSSVSIPPQYFTQFSNNADAQFFICQELIENLYLQQPPNNAYAISSRLLNIHTLREIYPEIEYFYPGNSIVTAKLLVGVLQFDNTQTFTLLSNSGVEISINNKKILSIGINMNYKLSSIQNPTISSKPSLMKMTLTASKNMENQLACKCGYLNNAKLNTFIDLFLIPAINNNQTYNSMELKIQSFFSNKFTPQIVVNYGNNILISSNYTSITN